MQPLVKKMMKGQSENDSIVKTAHQKLKELEQIKTKLESGQAPTGQQQQQRPTQA